MAGLFPLVVHGVALDRIQNGRNVLFDFTVQFTFGNIGGDLSGVLKFFSKLTQTPADDGVGV